MGKTGLGSSGGKDCSVGVMFSILIISGTDVLTGIYFSFSGENWNAAKISNSDSIKLISIVRLYLAL